jgi:hypothetical protein
MLSMTGILVGCLIASGLTVSLAKLVKDHAESACLRARDSDVADLHTPCCYSTARRASLTDPNTYLQGE